MFENTRPRVELRKWFYHTWANVRTFENACNILRLDGVQDKHGMPIKLGLPFWVNFGEMAWEEFGQIMCVVEDIGGRPFPICLWRREIWAACPTRQSREKLREIWKRHETAKEIPPDIQGPPFVIGPEEGGPKDQLMPEKDFSSVDPFSCYRQGPTRLVRVREPESERT